MKIHEHQAMKIFGQYGVPVVGFDVVATAEEARYAAEKAEKTKAEGAATGEVEEAAPAE